MIMSWGSHYCEELPFEMPLTIQAYPVDTVPVGKSVILINKRRGDMKRCLLSCKSPMILEGWSHWAEYPQIEYPEG
jgi:hypothetical protein